ncbi:MAG: DNA double-strand break repair nuclease NurA [Promethearchaeota archaeon]|nr:MAG: DNA double-strand break repair nuclease NurA [Candidatus Lokiarchaeota archaeon]
MKSEHPFSELPETLIIDMLDQCDAIGIKLSKTFHELYDIKKEVRNKLKKENLLKKDSEIMLPPTNPTSCAVDGSFSIEKLLSTDIVATAGVAVEGLAPPSEQRHWPRPRHYSKILTIPHKNSTKYISSAIMMCMELNLAVKAPHNVIFFDGSFVTPLVFINQALNSLNQGADDINDEFKRRLKIALAAYVKMILSKKTDQIFVAVPKYTTRQEITHRILKLNNHFEDRGLLSFILKPGEVVGPLSAEKGANRYYIENAPMNTELLIKKIIKHLDELYILYYRPHDHIPALRLEVSPAVAKDRNRLSVLLEAVKIQTEVPGLMEPFPLYLADRMVKHLRTALPAIRKTTTQEMSTKWDGKYSDLFFAMHGYRTETWK